MLILPTQGKDFLRRCCTYFGIGGALILELTSDTEGWTKYGADGKEISAASRYKALGNAIALPCAEYIMAGIAEVLR